MGIPLAVGLALYLPQYDTGPPIRVAHGLLMSVACLLLAWETFRVRDRTAIGGSAGSWR
jgi:hypothetical protein